MNKILFGVSLLALVASPAFAADANYILTLKDHRFTPAEIKVPANTAVIVKIVNLDATAEEFDSDDLDVEKVVAGKSEGTVRLRPLKAGTYKFEGEYHDDIAQGVVIAQ